MPEKRQGISAKRQQSGNAAVAASSALAKSRAQKKRPEGLSFQQRQSYFAW
jgi:hypothetical protein